MSEEELYELAFKDTTELLTEDKNVLLDIIEVLHQDRRKWLMQCTKTHNEGVDIQQERNKYKKLYEKEKEKNEIQGQTIKGQQHTIRLLKKHNKEQKHNHKLQYKKIKHNWNELRERLNEAKREYRTRDCKYLQDYYEVCVQQINNILDKMEEIERL